MGREKNPSRVSQLHWVLTREMHEDVLGALFKKSSSSYFVEERGFLGLIFPGSGMLRRNLFLHRIIPQEEGWVNSNGAGLAFSPHYFSRALDYASKAGPMAGIVIVHSHPFGTRSLLDRPEPSRPDLFHERRLLFQLAKALPKGAPVAAGIAVPNGAWRVREYHWPKPMTAEQANSSKFSIGSGSFTDATATRIVSKSVELYRYDIPKALLLDKEALDSTIRLWGEEGHQILGNLRVGVAGVGGVGSIIVEYLSRLGVGELMLVDFDVVSKENLNRMIGVRRDEIGKPKIEYAARIAKQAATAKEFEVRTFRGSVGEEEGLKHMLDCDVIMNAADSPLARQVLDHASYSHEIPVIDGGTVIVVQGDSGALKGKSQVSVAGPGNPCFECVGNYNQDEATMAREKTSMRGEFAYLKVVGKRKINALRAPSVISFNGLVASVMVHRFLSMTLGLPPRGSTGQQKYYIDEGVLGWGAVTGCKQDCPKRSWTGLGDSHPVPVGIDPDWKAVRTRKQD